MRLAPRDHDVLAALDRGPLTLEQLLKLSQTFPLPFTSYRRCHERLQQLTAAGWVRRSPYATASRGVLHYYHLSRAGFAGLHGEETPLPTKRYCSPVGFAREPHTRALADFIVHTAVGAHRAGVTLSGFCRENTVRLRVGDESVFPDAAFQLVRAGSYAFSFFAELDNASEPVTSLQNADAWERKIRLYDALQDRCARRFRVLIVTTRRSDRLAHILDLAGRLVRNPHRSLFYGTNLPAYLDEAEPLTAPCFSDHRGRRIALVPLAAERSLPENGALESAPVTPRSPSRVLARLC